MNRKKLLISVLSFSLMATLISVENKSIEKETGLDLLVTDLNEMAIGKVNLSRHNLQVGKDNVLATSQTYVQHGIDSTGKNMLRFVTAVKGDIETLSYTLNYKGLETPLSKEITTVYKGIQNGESYSYYDGTSFTTTECSDYYFACVTIRFKDSSNDALELTAQLTVNGTNETKTVEAKTATLDAAMSPTLKVNTEDSSTFDVQGASITLPVVTEAKSSRGTDLLSDVVIKDLTDSSATISDGKLTSNVVGTHIIEYSLTDSLTNKTVKVTRNIEVYRKLFTRNPSNSTVNEKTTKNSQTVTLNDQGETISILNLAASKVYYAEAEFEGINYNVWNGFAHIPGNIDFESARWLDSAIRPSDKTTIFLDSKGWATNGDRYHSHIDENMGVPFSGNTIKYAVARINDYFYAFVNEHYVGTYTSDYYSNIDTIPGIFCNGYGDQEKLQAGLEVTNIDFYNDVTAVTAKVNALTGDSIIRPYDINEFYSYLPKNFSIGRNDTDGQYVEVLPNSDGQNANVWSPWIYFASDFTFEFDYTYASSSHGGDSQAGRMWIELRPWTYGASFVEFGAKYSMDNPQFMMDQEGYKNGTEEEGDKYKQPEFSSFGITKDSLKTIHYKISRKLTSDYNEITMTISNPATNDVIVTHTVNTYTKYDDKGNKTYRADEEVVILVQSRDVSGKFTNITWSTSAN